MPLPLLAIGLGIAVPSIIAGGAYIYNQITKQSIQKTEQAKQATAQAQIQVEQIKTNNAVSDVAKVASTPSQIDDILLYGQKYILPVILVVALIAIAIMSKGSDGK